MFIIFLAYILLFANESLSVFIYRLPSVFILVWAKNTPLAVMLLVDLTYPDFICNLLSRISRLFSSS